MNKEKTEIIQINLGNKCNQICAHCHIEASPKGNKNMNFETAQKIADKIKNIDVEMIEFTGGEPELNPNLQYFIETLSKYNKKMTVRTNLTVLDIPEYYHFLDFYKKYKVKIISSLPSFFEDTTDRQRGKRVFQKSIKVLKKLNEIGYSRSDLILDLVYNPDGDYLPPDQNELEIKYKKQLKEKYNICFNNLITIVNSPIKRFKEDLIKRNRYDDYLKELKDKFNDKALEKVMCKKLISINYQGYVYDCDFNLALDKRIKNYQSKKFWEIDFDHYQSSITLLDHCYACTVNMGSSCHGTLIKDTKENNLNVIESVKKYYGEEIKQTTDLKTSACCTTESIPDYIKKILCNIHDEILMKYYGCGSPIPLVLNGLKVLDLGCGTGRDCYVLSNLVGEKGFVHGIDMTENQLKIAQKHIHEQTERFHYQSPNVNFILDRMENIDKYFKEESLNLIISNCVLNLLEDKEIVLKKAYMILQKGGELYFSDIYADRRIPSAIRNNRVLHGECLGGALYINDFIRICRRVGFIDPRIINQKGINITDPQIKNLIGNTKFYSITYRLWKIEGLEDKCEDFGHIAIYKGGIKESPHKFELDMGHTFYKNKPEKVCGNTALMISQTRFKEYFKLIGNFSEHFGEFQDCSTNSPGEDNKNNSISGVCC